MDSLGLGPFVGRRIALELRPTRPLTWLGPIPATLCGAVAATGIVFSGETLLRAAIAILLTDPILGAWRAAWVNTDWRRPLRGWKNPTTRAWMLVPYARLGSPAARLSQWLSSRAEFWRRAVAPQVGQAIGAIVVTGLIALSVALVLGTTTFLLTILALLLAPIEGEIGANGAGRWMRALAEIGMAWLIGSAALSLATPTLDSTVLALLFALVYRGLLSLESHRELALAISNLAQVLIVIFAFVRGAPLSGSIIGLALLAQVLWQAAARRTDLSVTPPVAQKDDGTSERMSSATYLTRVQWFVLGAMLVSAVALPR